jgi:hypothetical protein
LGLVNFFHQKNKETWRYLNEASTESLTQEILKKFYLDGGKKYWRKNTWIDIQPYLDDTSWYQRWINILNSLEEIDKIPKALFWKAMLIRKRADWKKVEINTPLYELMTKMNGKEIKNNKIKYTRPYYYTLISNTMDFIWSLAEDDTFRKTNILKDFITTKNIIFLKTHLQAYNKNLSDVFDKQLLNKEGTDFNEEILQTYK